MTTDTTALARQIAAAALDKLGTDIRLIDLREVVSYTDYFVVVTGSNTRQTQAISEQIVTQMMELGYKRPRRREQDPEGTWVLLDYVDVVVHVFTPEAREFYRLETLWGQVPQETIEDPHTAASSSEHKERSSIDHTTSA